MSITTLQVQPRHGCVITNMHLVGMSGMDLQKALICRQSLLPLIFAGKRLSTGIIVRLMRAGAISILESPIEKDELWFAVREGLAENLKQFAAEETCRELRQRFGQLSAGEQSVVNRICEGSKNAEIASHLDVSVRTVESRKQRILAKTGHASISQMIMSYQRFLFTDQSDPAKPLKNILQHQGLVG